MPKRGEPFSMFEPATNPSSKWLIVGEAPGEEEDRANRPFVGASGKLLNSLLKQAGFGIEVSDHTGLRTKSDFHFTNVFTTRPPDNDLKKHWTLTKTELQKLGYSPTGRLPKLNNRFIHPEHEAEVARLKEEIRQLAPEFVLILGGTALWALTGESRITINRGTLLPLHLEASEASTLALSECSTGLPIEALSPPALIGLTSKASSPEEQTSAVSLPGSLTPIGTPALVEPRSCRQLPSWALQQSPMWALPAFHPAMVLRQWDNRPLLWADLVKSRRFLQGALPQPLRRLLWLDPTLEDLAEVYQRFLSRPQADKWLGVDIETDPRIGQITTISFGFPDEAICIPFYNKAALPDQCNYWQNAAQEAEAWKWVKRFAALPHKKVGQNFLYDHQYLLEDLDIRVRNVNDDTAILQHCLQPELPKALGTLASLYLNEPAWKFMRESTKDVNKADD